MRSEQIPVPERVAQAAIRIDGEIFTGRNHAEALIYMEESFPDWDTKGFKPEDGFVTNTGRYIDRDEAGRIAHNSGQLSHLSAERRRDAKEFLDSNWVDDLKSNPPDKDMPDWF